ncbi:hypothetical protein [Stigmatella aurantiaca]|uniref:Uncharacterized protein n=1 Tax=Stigmatella aurantiaca (strain DW4/3-1) TaxID=378806 RepID=E3FDZ2_STIAD|nr:hypothetical protein [Stigmatella aurantiaca]ADO71407.1 uncharacterized protein STAUR_3617 [Stigmatella aurantiaca DW4/3-1]
MKSINLVALAVFGTTALTGCGVEQGEVQDDASSLEAPAQEFTSPFEDASKDSVPSVALDGRAAAAAEGVRGMAASPGLMGLASSWYSGSVAAGATQHWYWNNSSLTSAYSVGLSPTGASTTSGCRFEVTRTWDVQQYGGEREFHFSIKNIGSIACGTNILLASRERTSTWATGGIDVGASKSWTWNNANPLTATHIVGLSPSGSTSANPCQLEVTRTWYAQQPGGEREFKFTVKNIGAIACQGDVQLAVVTSANSSWSTGSLSPGASGSWVWNNANPLDRVYAPGLSPAGALGTTPCQLEVTKSSYQQVIDSDGTTERKYYFTVQNVGSLTCSGTLLLNYL